jgi:hypothetical protein
VEAFRKGNWFDRSSHFVLCTSASLVPTGLVEECERQRLSLQEDGITFLVWDCEQISEQLKTKPEIVDEFFGRAWLGEFCGPEYSLAYQSRLDGSQVTKFREGIRRFYEVLTEQLDPGIPVPPSQQRGSIPFSTRYVLPDIQIQSEMPDTERKGSDGQVPVDASQDGAREWIVGNPEVMAKILVNGLTGKVQVASKEDTPVKLTTLAGESCCCPKSFRSWDHMAGGPTQYWP